MIIYTSFIPKGFDGMSIWPFILMRYRDTGLLNHELVHYTEQAWITPIWWLRYALSRSFRVAAEVRAYKASMQAGMTLEAASFWLTKYDKNLTVDGARALLTQ